MNSPMKKVLAALLASAILGGCGSPEQERNNPSGKDSEITAEQMETVMAWWETQPQGICSLSDEAAFDFAGGMAAGTILTAHLSEGFVVATITAFGPYAAVVPAVVPAVAPALAVGGGVAALTYAGIKTYCMGQAAVGHRISDELGE